MIDDVDYLLENNEKDSMVLYIDSSLRNKLYYPNANEYTIQFEQPFKNVYGFEVIDGAIPNTMYNIDVYNNKINFTTIIKSGTTISSTNTYNEFNEIFTCKTLISMFNSEIENYIIVGYKDNLETIVNETTDPGINRNYAIFYKDQLTNISIGRKYSQIEKEYYFFKYKNVEYAVIRSIDNEELINILKEQEFSFDPLTGVIIYYRIIFVDSVTYAKAKLSGAYIVTINNYRKELALGNYDILSITNDLSDIMNTYFIDVEPTTSPPKKEGKIMMSSRNYFLLNASIGGILESMGFDTRPSFSETSSNFKSWVIGDNFMVYGGVIDTTLSSLSYKIISPGLINLLGERFCILRIKELEDHLFGSYSYMSFTPGIGMFKMTAGAGGVTNLRFDYTNLVRKPFHPIGKLDRLSLKFETAKGHLYDFKGVNHQLMFIIKFFVPSKKEKFTKSILNPNYDPNIMKYLSNNRTIQYKEDSDDEEDFDNDDYYQMYKKELDDLDYSESSDEEHGEDDSEEEI
jgi:hypothetical protein